MNSLKPGVTGRKPNSGRFKQQHAADKAKKDAEEAEAKERAEKEKADAEAPNNKPSFVTENGRACGWRDRPRLARGPPDEQWLRQLERRLAVDDAVLPFVDWCWLLGISEATGRRIIGRGEITVTHLSDRRIGIRGRHHREFLDRRASTADLDQTA
jgi:hypothetical protein